MAIDKNYLKIGQKVTIIYFQTISATAMKQFYCQDMERVLSQIKDRRVTAEYISSVKLIV
jgi:hypothetical protein